MTKKEKSERKVLFWIDVNTGQSIDNYERYAKDLPTVESKTELFTKATTIEEMIQDTLEQNLDKKSRGELVQHLVDTFDMPYTKAARTYEKFKETK